MCSRPRRSGTGPRSRVVLLMIDLPQAGISLERAEGPLPGLHSLRRPLVSQACSLAPGRTRRSPPSRATMASRPRPGWPPSTAICPPARWPRPARPVHSSLDEAVADRPWLQAAGTRDGFPHRATLAATTRLASLMQDPEFESLARENFVVAQVPRPRPGRNTRPRNRRSDELLGGEELPPETVEIVVTDDGHTPLFAESGDQEPRPGRQRPAAVPRHPPGVATSRR